MQIIFEFPSQYGTYRDALYFEDNAIPSDAEIEAMKQERFDKWMFNITNPPAPVPSKYVRDENGNLVLDANGDPIPTGV